MGHWYNPDTGDRSNHPVEGWLPSVSTVLQATKPFNQRRGLEAARNKNVFKFDQKLASACTRGTTIHEWIAAYLQRNALPELDFKYSPYQQQLTPYLKRVMADSASMLIEKPLFGNGFAGCPDLVALNQDSLDIEVIDWKCKDKPIHPDSLREAVMQLTGYAAAYQHEYGVPVDTLVVVEVRPTCIHVYRFDPAITMPSWEARLAAYNSARVELACQ